MTTGDKIKLLCTHLKIQERHPAIKAGLTPKSLCKMVCDIHDLALAAGVNSDWLGDDAQHWPPPEILRSPFSIVHSTRSIA